MRILHPDVGDRRQGGGWGVLECRVTAAARVDLGISAELQP
jgi:hypothetical protein